MSWLLSKLMGNKLVLGLGIALLAASASAALAT